MKEHMGNYMIHKDKQSVVADASSLTTTSKACNNSNDSSHEESKIFTNSNNKNLYRDLDSRAEYDRIYKKTLQLKKANELVEQRLAEFRQSQASSSDPKKGGRSDIYKTINLEEIEEKENAKDNEEKLVSMVEMSRNLSESDSTDDEFKCYKPEHYLKVSNRINQLVTGKKVDIKPYKVNVTKLQEPISLNIKRRKSKEEQENSNQSNNSTMKKNKELTDIEEKILMNLRFIEYSKLHAEDKTNLIKLCKKKLRSKEQKSTICKIIKSIKALFIKEKKKEDEPVFPFIYKVIDEIRRRCLNELGLFRLEGNRELYRMFCDMLSKEQEFDVTSLDIHTLGSCFKMYIRDVMDGLIPKDVCDGLLELYDSKIKEKDRDMLLGYLPFVFTDERRKLLLATFDLLRDIDKRSASNKMTLNNIFSVITPTLFPDKTIKKLDDIFTQKKILLRLIDMDFDHVPREFIPRD